jgi:hypothetical protein
MTPEDLLTRTFAEVTETTDYPTTSLATVVARSRTLRHGRRRTTALLAAAATVALVGGSVAVWLHHDAGTTPTPSHRVDPAASLPDIAQGGAPGVAYLEGDTFVTAAGDRITSPTFRRAQTATPYADGVLVVARTRPAAPFTTISFVTGGSTTRIGCGTPGFALGGDAPAYWLSDTCGFDVTGRLVRGTTETPTAKNLALYPVRTVAGGVAANAAWTNSTNADGPVVVAADGSLHRIPHLSILLSVSPAGNLVAGRGPVARGLVPVVANASTGAVVWRAHGWELGHFSVSGRYLVGTEKLGAQTVTGIGDEVGIWDAATGRQVTGTTLPNMSVVGNPVWEGDGSVLVVAEDRHHQQAIVRLGLDGTITRATPVAPERQGSYRLASTP